MYNVLFLFVLVACKWHKFVLRWPVIVLNTSSVFNLWYDK